MPRHILSCTLILALLLAETTVAKAQDSTRQAIDSIARIVNNGFDPSKSYSYNTSRRDFYKMLYAGVPLVGAGLALHSSNENFKSFRNEYAKQYHTHYDDLLQYSPAVVMLGMKACGVDGRSSWGRMLASDAFAVALMASVVNTTKHTVAEWRPDGSNRRSFPSGHTATAFMCATMLHKEYGHISPWISIGGYALATTTGVSRILNNKHWIADVMAGAGIGILSTEIGYFLADLIFRENGLHKYELPERHGRWHKPSYLGLSLGYNISGSKFHTPYGVLTTKLGISAGIEGAYYFNPFIGVGGRVSFAHMPLEMNRDALPHDMQMNSTCAGLFLSYPFSSWVQLSAKVLGGFNHFTGTSVADGFAIGGNNTGIFSTGVSVVVLSSRAFNLRFFCDYSVTQSYVPDATHKLHTITSGSILGVNF